MAFNWFRKRPKVAPTAQNISRRVQSGRKEDRPDNYVVINDPLMDPLSPLNPLNPLSPLNPLNPINQAIAETTSGSVITDSTSEVRQEIYSQPTEYTSTVDTSTPDTSTSFE